MGKNAFFWILTCSIILNSGSNVFEFDFWSLLATRNNSKNFRGYPGGPSATFEVVLKGGTLFCNFHRFLFCAPQCLWMSWSKKKVLDGLKYFLISSNEVLKQLIWYIHIRHNLYSCWCNHYFFLQKVGKMQLHIKIDLDWSKHVWRMARVWKSIYFSRNFFWKNY